MLSFHIKSMQTDGRMDGWKDRWTDGQTDIGKTQYPHPRSFDTGP